MCTNNSDEPWKHTKVKYFKHKMPHITELYLLMSNNRSFCLSQIDKFIETKWTISDDQSLKGEGKKITKAGEESSKYSWTEQVQESETTYISFSIFFNFFYLIFKKL